MVGNLIATGYYRQDTKNSIFFVDNYYVVLLLIVALLYCIYRDISSSVAIVA